MTPTDFRAALLILNLSQLDAAKVLGVGARTVRHWAGGTATIPAPAAKLLTLMRLGLLSVEQVRHTPPTDG